MKKSLCKSDKLTLKADFDTVCREGKKYLTGGIVVLIAPALDNKLKCGIICSRKFSVRAVKRNRARRILWESFRLLKPRIQPCRIVLITRRMLMDYMQPQAMLELEKALKKAGLILPGSSSIA